MSSEHDESAEMLEDLSMKSDAEKSGSPPPKKFQGAGDHAKAKRKGRRGKRRKQRKASGAAESENQEDSETHPENRDSTTWDSDEELDCEINAYNDVIIRPVNVPKAPENSTQFIIDDHNLCHLYMSFETPNPYFWNFPQYSGKKDGETVLEPAGTDAAYEDIDFEYDPPQDFDNSAYNDKEFELSYQSNRFDELLRLPRPELVSGVRLLERRVKDLSAELVKENPSPTLEQLQAELLELQEKHIGLKDSNTSLVAQTEAGSDISAVENSQKAKCDKTIEQHSPTPEMEEDQRHSPTPEMEEDQKHSPTLEMEEEDQRHSPNPEMEEDHRHSHLKAEHCQDTDVKPDADVAEASQRTPDVGTLSPQSVSKNIEKSNSEHPTSFISTKQREELNRKWQKISSCLPDFNDVISRVKECDMKSQLDRIFGKLADVASRIEKLDDVVSCVGKYDVASRVGKLVDAASRVERLGDVVSCIDRLDDVASRFGRLDNVSSRVDRLDDVVSCVDKLDDVASCVDRLDDVNSRVVGLNNMNSHIEALGDVNSHNKELKEVKSTIDKLNEVKSTIDKLNEVKSSVDDPKDISSSIYEGVEQRVELREVKSSDELLEAKSTCELERSSLRDLPCRDFSSREEPSHNVASEDLELSAAVLV